MLVVTGIFENERFIPDKPVSIPQNKKVVVTIDEDTDEEIKSANKWREIGEAILSCDEELPGSPFPQQPCQGNVIVLGTEGVLRQIIVIFGYVTRKTV